MFTKPSPFTSGPVSAASGSENLPLIVVRSKISTLPLLLTSPPSRVGAAGDAVDPEARSRHANHGRLRCPKIGAAGNSCCVCANRYTGTRARLHDLIVAVRPSDRTVGSVAGTLGARAGQNHARIVPTLGVRGALKASLQLDVAVNGGSGRGDAGYGVADVQAAGNSNPLISEMYVPLKGVKSYIRAVVPTEAQAYFQVAMLSPFSVAAGRFCMVPATCTPPLTARKFSAGKSQYHPAAETLFAVLAGGPWKVSTELL